MKKFRVMALCLCTLCSASSPDLRPIRPPATRSRGRREIDTIGQRG